MYELQDKVNPFAYRIAEFCRHYDGVHVLLKNRAEVGEHYLPSLNNETVARPDFANAVSPGHYHHNWRF